MANGSLMDAGDAARRRSRGCRFSQLDLDLAGIEPFDAYLLKEPSWQPFLL